MHIIFQVLKSSRYIEGFHLKYRVMPDLFHRQGKGGKNKYNDYNVETVSRPTIVYEYLFPFTCDFHYF